MDELKFCYKGNRTYVHGTDMYNATCRHLRAKSTAPLGNIDLVIHRIVTHNMEAGVWPADQIPSEFEPALTMRFTQEGTQYVTGLFESEEVIDCRYPYDEDSIGQTATLSRERRTIALANTTPYTSIEVIVALNKILMQTLFVDAPGKWYFTRLRLQEELPAATNVYFVVEHTRSLGLRLTQSRVFMNEMPIGDIFFSLVTASDKK